MNEIVIFNSPPVLKVKFYDIKFRKSILNTENPTENWLQRSGGLYQTSRRQRR